MKLTLVTSKNENDSEPVHIDAGARERYYFRLSNRYLQIHIMSKWQAMQLIIKQIRSTAILRDIRMKNHEREESVCGKNWYAVAACPFFPKFVYISRACAVVVFATGRIGKNRHPTPALWVHDVRSVVFMLNKQHNTVLCM